MSYNDKLVEAMKFLSEKEDTIFLGQGLQYGGIAISNSFKEIPQSKKMEMPVAENLQLGLSIGLALEGYVPVSVFPRWNFLILAADQLVNHLDKLVLMTDGQYKPKVIIRVASGTKYPINPQEQHLGDFTEPFRLMLKNINVVKLNDENNIINEYKKAYERKDGISTILVEEHQF